MRLFRLPPCVWPGHMINKIDSVHANSHIYDVQTQSQHKCNAMRPIAAARGVNAKRSAFAPLSCQQCTMTNIFPRSLFCFNSTSSHSLTFFLFNLPFLFFFFEPISTIFRDKIRGLRVSKILYFPIIYNCWVTFTLSLLFLLFFYQKISTRCIFPLQKCNVKMRVNLSQNLI